MEVSDSILVHYDGKGQQIQSHLMPSLLVASSVKAFETLYSEAFKEANRVYGCKIETGTYIQGGFNPGSLKWLQKLVSKQAEEQLTVDGLSPQAKVPNAVSKVISILTRAHANMPEIVIREAPEGFEVELEGENVAADELECAILTNEKIRKAISDLAQPLKQEGIDTLTIDSCGHSFEPIKIEKDSAKSLIQKKTHVSLVEEGSFDGFYKVEDLSYNPSKAWKFISIKKPSDTFSATIEDDVFWKSVASNTEKFSCDDIMEIHVSWRKIKKSFSGRAKTTYVVTSIRHYDKDQGDPWKLL
ncbi:hypothetical protein QPP83_001634 [Vibrio parahaemolyticus]|nr:hypothetical protein [Vibrio parahaemolyticus]